MKALLNPPPPGWHCPACGRPYPACGPVALHHDHGSRHGASRAELAYWSRRPHGPPRFAPTVLCWRCNAADGVVKRKLGLPRDFSFAPWEIAALVTPTPRGHQIDYACARALVAELAARGIVAPRPLTEELD